MQIQDIIARCHPHAVLAQEPIQHGVQIRLANGATINRYDTGKILVQGKAPIIAATRALLGLDDTTPAAAPASQAATPPATHADAWLDTLHAAGITCVSTHAIPHGIQYRFDNKGVIVQYTNGNRQYQGPMAIQAMMRTVLEAPAPAVAVEAPAPVHAPTSGGYSHTPEEIDAILASIPEELRIAPRPLPEGWTTNPPPGMLPF